jgi:hypothetical protein
MTRDEVFHTRHSEAHDYSYCWINEKKWIGKSRSMPADAGAVI